MKKVKLPGGTYVYDPNKPLGKRGGFGQVFAGKSLDGGDIAVKKLHLDAADAAHRELRIGDELRGRSFAHVVPFIDAGADAETGVYFVVMPKAEGSLQNSVEKSGSLSSAQTAEILLQIVNGLIEVGELVHRDLKPDNILFHDGKWKVADFGIARFVEEATSTNTLKDCLSPLYAAPEQWRFERATHATDVYALGCIAFCLLTGKPPFMQDPSAQHQSAPAPDFVCAEPRLKTLVNMCLRKVDATRPSLIRMRDGLAEIVKSPQPTTGDGALGALASVAAGISKKEQESQALRESEAAKRRARTVLAHGAFEILDGNIERLWGKIHFKAPNAVRVARGRMGGLQCKLGDGQLVVDLQRSAVVEPDSFPNSGWDVVAYSKIEVFQSQPGYRWSASLWYVKPKGKDDYRWYEAAYWSYPGSEFEPYAEGPGRDADLAASHIMHSVRFAYSPIVVDDEEESNFHERWIILLAKAVDGKLRRPQQFPFRWPDIGR